jgi:antitoxin (DNA-binding transcriptional repressor) of toxin-antitoxin stability system
MSASGMIHDKSIWETADFQDLSSAVGSPAMTKVNDYCRRDFMPTIAAGQFRATCLKLLDTILRAQEPLITTKRGVPVAKRVPIPQQTPLSDTLAGSVREERDIVSPLENTWEACR